jgi:hypothetical protein
MNESLLQGKKAVEVVVMMVVLDERDGRRDFPATVCPPPPAKRTWTETCWEKWNAGELLAIAAYHSSTTRACRSSHVLQPW